MKRLIARLLSVTGYGLHKLPTNRNLPRLYPDVDSAFFTLAAQCKDYTCTSYERMFAVFNAVEYLVKNSIPGDIVECGVWRGGSMMMAALSLLHFGDDGRDIYLYDTFEGMSAPTEKDVAIPTAKTAEHLLKTERSHYLCDASLDIVKVNMAKTKYPINRIHYVKGKVEDTIPATVPEQIALLRLDTDFYESTLHEMNHLYPLLSTGGVLIQDDYGFWQGAKQATDEYIKKHHLPLLLHRIDGCGRCAVKL